MTSAELQDWVVEIVSTLAFSWTQTKPEMLHTIHRLALATSPKTSHIEPPFDEPVHDLVTNTQIRPSEMQDHLLSTVVPAFLPSIQAIAEDILNDHFGDSPSIFARLEGAVADSRLDRQLASSAHHWRIVRNVVAHGAGIISQRTEAEVLALYANQKISFTSFTLWGSLLDAGHGGTLVPVTSDAVSNPDFPKPSIVIPATAGSRVQIGLGDLLAASRIWSRIIKVVCNK